MRERLFHQIRAAYRVRSSIVHGYDQKGIDKNLKKLGMFISQTSEFIEELLRESLRRFLNHRVDGRSIEDVMNAVDTALLNESKFGHSGEDTK